MKLKHAIALMSFRLSMWRWVLLLLGVASVVGCSSHAPLSAEEAVARQQRLMAHLNQTFGPACEKLGHAPDTEAWRTCLLQLSAQHEAEQKRLGATPYYGAYYAAPLYPYGVAPRNGSGGRSHAHSPRFVFRSPWVGGLRRR